MGGGWGSQELLVPLGPGENHVYPYAHGLRGGGDEEVGAVVRLDAERQPRGGALDGAQVVDVHLLDRLEVDAPPGLRLGPVAVVEQRALGPVEHEPPLVPRLELVAHLVQEATAAGRRGDDLVTRLQVVARRLDVLPQVELLVADREVSGQRSSLRRRRRRRRR